MTNATIVHLDHAGSSPPPPSVTQTIVDHLELELQVGGYAAQNQAVHKLNKSYQQVGDLLNASPDEIALVESATVGWQRLFYSMVQLQEDLMVDDEATRVILVSEAEYAAQVVAVTQFCNERKSDETKWEVRAIPSLQSEDGRNLGIVDVEALERILERSRTGLEKQLDHIRKETPVRGSKDGTRIVMVCVTQVPTNSGIVNPVEEIGRVIEDHNQRRMSEYEYKTQPTLYLVDACQSVGQMEVDVQKIRCHGLSGTGRKYLRGPRGTGFLFVQDVIADQLVPAHVDHHCAPVSFVPTDYPLSDRPINEIIRYNLKPGARRFEFWESNIATSLGIGEAARYAAQDVGIDRIWNEIQTKTMYLKQKLRMVPGLTIYHDHPGNVAGLVTFALGAHDSAFVAKALWSRRLETRFALSVVPATSTPLDSAVSGVPDLLRASVSYTTTPDEIDAFAAKLVVAADRLNNAFND